MATTVNTTSIPRSARRIRCSRRARQAAVRSARCSSRSGCARRYGETGNRPNYGNKFTPLSAINAIGGNSSVVLGVNAGDSNIKPERQREFEGGIDIASKDQRIVAELTLYQRNISDMLLQQSLATTTGFTTQFTNGGSMRNRGIEAPSRSSRSSRSTGRRAAC